MRDKKNKRHIKTVENKTYLVYTIVFCLVIPDVVVCLEKKKCKEALGLESGAIKDDQLTASSSYVPTVGPSRARLHQDLGGGAWCPRPQIEAGVREYIEIDLQKVYLITEIATQGRYDKGRGQEYMEEYKIEYWRPKLDTWREYKRWDGKSVVSGNSDVVTVVRQELRPALAATRLRVLPYSVHRRTVCTRLELYGCLGAHNALGGVVSYSAPASEGVLNDLNDTTYDGHQREDGLLVNGLGRLTDGEVGADSFTLDIGHGKGTAWVAWNVKYFPKKHIVLNFEFDGLRNFSTIDIYTNNFFSRHVQIFGRAAVHFSISGKFYSHDPILFHPRADKKSEKARNVTIKINKGAIGKYVKIKLYFVQTYIMISEVYFTSDLITGNITGIDPDHDKNDEELPIFDSYGNILLDGRRVYGGDMSDYYIEFGIGVSLALLIIAGASYLGFFLLNKHGQFAGQPTISMRSNPFERLRRLVLRSGTDSVVEIPTVTTTQATTKQPLRHEHYQEICLNNQKSTISELTKSGYATKISLKPEKIYNRAQKIAINNTNFQTPVYAAGNSISDGCHIYHEPKDVANHSTQSEKRVSRQHKSSSLASMEPVDMTYEPYIPDTRTMNDMRCKMLSKQTNLSKSQWNTALSDNAPQIHLDGDLIPIPKFALVPHTTIGHCHAGEITICTTEKLKLIFGEVSPMVQVKNGRTDKNDNCLEYLQEIRLLSSLNHPNICNVLGLVTSELPPSLVQEFPPNEDLCRMLRNSSRTFSFQLLIFISAQIASAMKYLESVYVVHKDLAARNCLVCPNNKIKVADIAMCSIEYKNDYYLVSDRKIPIRWLSWESILLNRYTCASSVWSFGILVWEIHNHCCRSPYDRLSDEQVIELAEHHYYGKESQDLLSRPKMCPQDLYSVVKRCWRREEQDRPTFAELHSYITQRFHEDLPFEYITT